MNLWHKLFKSTLGVLRTEKGAAAGIMILIALTGISLYAVMSVPYQEVVRKWNTIEAWEEYPRNALPAWVNIFTAKKLPETIIIDSKVEDPRVIKEVNVVDGDFKSIKIVMTLDYQYNELPSEVTLKIVFSGSLTKRASIMLTWYNAKGVMLFQKRFALQGNYSYDISRDRDLLRDLEQKLILLIGKVPDYVADVITLLFGTWDETILKKSTVQVDKEKHKVEIEAIVMDPQVDVNTRLIIYGRIYGVAGTDGYRRDLWVGIIWGTPIALAFGLTAALLVTISQVFVGAISAWFGKAVDFTMQRLTEIFMNIPFYPLLIMISFVYKLDLWTLLLVIVGLSVFGSGVKTARSLFLALKEAPYIEAAKAYGANNFRIIILYMIPRILPTLVPNLITSVPYYVFLEASLAIIGVSGTLRSVVTWGRVLNDAFSAGALYLGLYHWVLIPSLFLFLASLGFALVGLSLEKALNPRLKEI
ncbi:MAG: ABC transporter permease [Thermoproteota archaeon]